MSVKAEAPRARPAGRPPQRVRIIGGAWRRTPVALADVPGLRPSPDRVRETLFNWLAHLQPDAAAQRGLDLFAGSGVLGFELASRGARQVVLVERQPLLLQRLRALKDRLGAQQVQIVAADAFEAAAQLPRGSFEIVFLDPPFGAGLLWPAVAAVVPLLAAGGLIYAESEAPIAPPEAARHGLDIVRGARAGRVSFHLLRPSVV